MAKNPKQDLKAFEAYLRHMYETSPYQPFTTEEIELILKSYGTPKDLKKYRDNQLVKNRQSLDSQFSSVKLEKLVVSETSWSHQSE